MWIVIIIVIAVILFGLIRGAILSSGTFKVINKHGVSMHLGNYNDCIGFAKTQNDFCKTFGIDDRYRVVKSDY